MEINLPESKSSKWIMSSRKKKTLRTAILLAFFILLAGCGTWLAKEYYGIDFLKRGKEDSAVLKKFSSYADLLAFMEENEVQNSNRNAYNASSLKGLDMGARTNSSSGWGATEAPSRVPAITEGWGSAGDGLSSGSSDYSTTNVQVEGVDEADIWKTDGRYIYAISKQKLLIMKAVPADEMEIISTIQLGYYPSGIYINGDKLAVFGSNYNIKPFEDYLKIDGNRNSSYADLSIYDISDRKSPRKEKQYDFEGSYVNSRMIGDYVYLVTTTTPVFAYYGSEQPVPYLLEDGVLAKPSSSPNVYYFDNADYISQNFTTVSSVNIKDAENIRNESYILDGNQNSMYVSKGNLYITFSKYTSDQDLMVAAVKSIIVPRLSEKNKERILEIENAKPYILNASEKSAKIAEIFERYYSSLNKEEKESLKKEMEARIKETYESISREKQKTVIHKLAIIDGKLKYEGKGEVSGRVLNQFAMDESAEGYFRIATTVDTSWSSLSDVSIESFNNLYVLDRNMKKAGQVEEIAKGEKIYSVRFMQNRAYMVTFKRTDPLFVIGLSDPANPSVLGELKVPGYSTYLHPYDDNKIIGLGRNATETGVEIDGIKLSLFDASDVSSPKEVDTYILGDYGSSSAALDDAKAFLFSKEKNLLAIPAVVKKQEGSSKYNSKTIAAGIAVFSVNDSGFEYKGIVDHRTEKEKESDAAGSYRYGNDTNPKRSLYIGDNLYSISNNYIKANRINDLENVRSLDASDAYNNKWSWKE